MAHQSVGIRWLVACLAPSDIAPHPNFKTDVATGAELLALIISFQWAEYATYAEVFDESPPSISAEDLLLIDAAKLALDSKTVHDGLSRLVSLTEDLDLTLGQRAAAAILVAVTDSEIDEPEAHLDILVRLASTIRASAGKSLSSRALATAVLLQQCALRSFEAGQLSRSHEFAQETLSVLADVGNDWEDFPVSRGVSWTAIDSQKRLAELIEGNAKALRSAASSLIDKSWAEIVRAPYPAAAVRPLRDSLSALATFVSETYDYNYVPTVRTSRFSRGDNISVQLYSSLLNAEIVGSLADVSRGRKLAGEVMANRIASGKVGSPGRYSEVIRLLRQGDENKQLQRFLNDVRLRGPLQDVKEAAERLVDARSRYGLITSSDLTLLKSAADVISPTYSDRAVRLACDYAEQKLDGRIKRSRVAAWKQVETTLRTVTALVQGNPGVNMEYVVDRVFNLVSEEDIGGDQFVFSALVNLSTSIDWDKVPSTSRDNWLALIGMLERSSEAMKIDRLRIRAAMNSADDVESAIIPEGLEYVVALIEQLLKDSQEKHNIRKAIEIVSELIGTSRRDAARGTFTGYAWSPYALAALLITKFEADGLWPVLISAIGDKRVSNENKLDALRVLTAAFPKIEVPRDVSRQLAQDAIVLTDRDSHPLLSVPTEQYAAALRNFYLAYGIMSAEEAQESILADASSHDVVVRSMCAEACLFASGNEPNSEWPLVLLLQLSHDRASVVTRSAAHGLAYLSVLSEFARFKPLFSRVRVLLAHPGIAAGSGVIRGLEDAIGVRRHLRPLWCKTELLKLSDDHLSREMRTLARRVLASY
ncbi:hypothetical protein [Actinomadura verrucosospora]